MRLEVGSVPSVPWSFEFDYIVILGGVLIMKSDSSKITMAEEKSSQIAALISGIVIAYAITCIIFIGYAILITYSEFSGENLPLVVTVTSLISVIVAGFDSAKGAENKGWLWGIFAGFAYAVILLCIGLWVNQGFKIDSRMITLFVLSIAGGGLGGVFGINLKRK